MSLRNQPYLPLYVQDIMTDEKLNECSASTHGIYIKGIMCLMHKSEFYGKLLLKQKYKQSENLACSFAHQLAKHLPYSPDEIEAAISELIREKVCHYDGDYLCQKRMIRDNEISEVRSEAGKKGGKRTQLDKAKLKAKEEANTEYESETKNEDDINKINVPFESFWDLYDKKRGERQKLEKKWNSLTNEERSEIMEYIPRYKEATPDKKFRKDPQTFLNNKSWNDEIILPCSTNDRVSGDTSY